MHLLFARTQIFSDQGLQVEHVDNLEQEEHDKQLWWLSHRAVICPQSLRTIFMKSRENDWHGQAINNNKKSKNDLQKVIRYLVEGMIEEHKKDKD